MYMWLPDPWEGSLMCSTDDGLVSWTGSELLKELQLGEVSTESCFLFGSALACCDLIGAHIRG